MPISPNLPTAVMASETIAVPAGWGVPAPAAPEVGLDTRSPCQIRIIPALPEPGRREPRHDDVIVILRIHQDREADLPLIGQARRRPRLLPRLGEDREKHRDEHGDDR